LQRLIRNVQITGVYGPFHFEDFLMANKPTYEELEQRVKELENGALDRKRSEEVLQRSTERFRRLFEQASDAFSIYDLNNGKIVDANESACKNLGYTRDELLELNVSDIEISQTPEEIVEISSRAEKGKHVIVEGIHRRKDGSTFPVEISLGMLQDEDPPLLLAIARDTTERKQAKEALLESEERLRIAGKAAYDLIYEWDVASNALEWFGDVDGLLGYRKGEISRDINAWLNLINPEDRVKLENAVELHKTSTEPIQYEYRVRHKDGTYRHWNDHGLPLLNDRGCPYKWIGVCADVTERWLAEEALREREEKYRLLADNITDNIWILDLDTLNFSYVSPSVVGITGYSAEEATRLQLQDTLTPSSMKLATEILSEELSRESRNADPLRSRTLELEQYHKDGTTFWTEVSMRFIRDAEGRPSSILGVTRDISERKSLQTQLQQAQKMEAIGILAGGVAHDLNNILGGLVSYPELLLLQLPEDSPLRKSILTIKKSGEKAAAVVQDLLTLARRGVVFITRDITSV